MRRFVVLLLAILAGCAATSAKQPPGPRVLFVGNSLTYYNDLPGIVQAMYAAAVPGRAIGTDMLAQGGARIADHLKAGRMAALLAERRYDVVVLQDLGGFPACGKTFPGCQDAVASVCEAAKQVRQAGAKPILFGTWQGRREAQQALSEVSRDEAAHCGLELVDVGAAMQRFRGEMADVSPWHEDGHPDLAGSWIAGAAMTRALVGRNLSPALDVAPFCRARWKGVALKLDEPASAQPRPDLDCERPPANVAAAAIRAVRKF